ncbi:unnamed protein product [Peronospora belbahrii]|uniref:Uncharacterized protein n=1 Tax=Peronospora belbahrii TaxID=622444 RepID=A0AAU9KX99_9STRA|nr:unnamed protein product [Peronospora belbahrii]
MEALTEHEIRGEDWRCSSKSIVVFTLDVLFVLSSSYTALLVLGLSSTPYISCSSSAFGVIVAIDARGSSHAMLLLLRSSSLLCIFVFISYQFKVARLHSPALLQARKQN